MAAPPCGQGPPWPEFFYLFLFCLVMWEIVRKSFDKNEIENLTTLLKLDYLKIGRASCRERVSSKV